MLEESFKIFLLLIILFSLSFVLDNFWNKIFLGKKYRIFITPGVVVHELSHALACLLVGAKVRKINFFSSRGGYVEYGPPKIPVFGQIFISFAPILGGIGVLLLLSWFWDLQLPIAVENVFFFIQENWLNWQFWLFIYLTISITICLTPSFKDFKNAFWGIVFLFLFGTILYYFNFFPQFLGTFFNKYLENILILGIVLEFLALFFTLPFYLIYKIKK